MSSLKNLARKAFIIAGGTAAAISMTTAPAQAAGVSTWDALAQCESGGNWSINTGNGYYGGLQFSPQSWVGAGGTGMPHQASKAEQIRVAENLLQMQGWGAWPACSAKLGLYGTPAPTTNIAPQRTETTPVTTESSQPAAEGTFIAPTGPAIPYAQAPAAPAAPTGPAIPYAVDTSTAEAAPVSNTYTVKAGDTLSAIAYAHGMNSWDELWNLNKDKISNPHLIEIGDVLTLPA